MFPLTEPQPMAVISPVSSEEDITYSLGDGVTDVGSEWWMYTSDIQPDSWAIALTLAAEYRFSAGISEISVTLDGECQTGECDLFWGIGDGDKFMTLYHDMDGGMRHIHSPYQFLMDHRMKNVFVSSLPHLFGTGVGVLDIPKLRIRSVIGNWRCPRPIGRRGGHQIRSRRR